jgi:rRNA maturation RNase YbeY
MNRDIDIIRKTDCPVDDAFLRAVVDSAIVQSRRSFPVSAGRVSVTVVLTDDAEVRAMNRDHRDRDATTDILSFPTFDGSDFEANAEGTVFLGDLVLSVPFIIRSAEEDGVSFERELAYILSHGVLHVLGLDHSEEMFAIQDAVADGIEAGGSVE